MHVHPEGRFGPQRRPILAAILVAAAACGPATGRAEIETIATEPGSRISIEVEGWTGLRLEACGRDVGLLPITVTIGNGSDSDHVWTIAATGDRGDRGFLPRTRIAVPAGAKGKTTLHVGTQAGWSPYTSFAVSGPGVSGGQFYVDGRTAQASGGGGTNPLTCGLSKGVQAAAGDPFKKYGPPGQPLDMATAPEDWRGWSAFRNVMLTEAEWRALPGAARKALLEWASTGGRAGVLAAKGEKPWLDDLPPPGPDGRRRTGAGEIVVIEWDGKTLAAAAVDRFLADTTGTTIEKLTADYAPGSSGTPYAMRGRAATGGAAGWEVGFGRLAGIFGQRSLPVGWILGFLSVFAIVAGPVNVLVLARDRRSRMFWTTPAISLVATAFLLGLMFLRDGVGGVGARRVLCLLAPHHKGLALIQEQFSRTGVLLGSSFPIAEPSWLLPLDDGGAGRLLEVDEQVRQGDWFRSRSDQAFLATAVRPSRARIELADVNGKPAVISSVDVPLDTLFVIDDEGRHWMATDVGTGEKKPLVPSDPDAFQKFFTSLREDAGPVRRTALDRLKDLRGYAYASTRGGLGKLPVQTLPAIRWTDERADFIGPLTRTAP